MNVFLQEKGSSKADSPRMQASPAVLSVWPWVSYCHLSLSVCRCDTDSTLIIVPQEAVEGEVRESTV